MKAPLARRLCAEFQDLSPEKAHLIRALVYAADDSGSLWRLIAEKCPETDDYARCCYSSPYSTYMWRVTLVLHAIDCILGTHGVGILRRSDDGLTDQPAYKYCNAGDPYTTTLIYDRDADALRIGCWGDIVEKGGFE